MPEQRNAWKVSVRKVEAGGHETKRSACDNSPKSVGLKAKTLRERSPNSDQSTESASDAYRDQPRLFKRLFGCPLSAVWCMSAVILWVIILVIIKSPRGYFEPQKTADYGPVWCEANYTRVKCDSCPSELKIYQIHQSAPHEGFMYGMTRRIKYNFYMHWNFFITISKMTNFSRAHFSLLTFDGGKVDSISLKFMLESMAGEEMIGYAFYNRSNFKPTTDPSTASGLLSIIQDHASHMSSMRPEQWTFLTPIDKKFFLRIDRGPHGGLLRSGACSACKIPVFKKTIAALGGFDHPGVTQVFTVSWDKDSKFDYSLQFMKRCYVTDGHEQYCPTPDSSLLERCWKLYGTSKGPKQ